LIICIHVFIPFPFGQIDRQLPFASKFFIMQKTARICRILSLGVPFVRLSVPHLPPRIRKAHYTYRNSNGAYFVKLLPGVMFKHVHLGTGRCFISDLPF
jgi:hypothetical protein